MQIGSLVEHHERIVDFKQGGYYDKGRQGKSVHPTTYYNLKSVRHCAFIIRRRSEAYLMVESISACVNQIYHTLKIFLTLHMTKSRHPLSNEWICARMDSQSLHGPT